MLFKLTFLLFFVLKYRSCFSDRSGGYNFTKDSEGDVTNFEDFNGHGTHVAGTIAASFNDIGIVGVAPEISLLILKVLNYRGSRTVDSLVKAIDYAINWAGPNNEKELRVAKKRSLFLIYQKTFV